MILAPLKRTEYTQLWAWNIETGKVPTSCMKAGNTTLAIFNLS